MLEIGF